MTHKRIAVVDDEPDILELVSIHLKKSGFEVSTYDSALPFLEDLSKQSPVLVVLDLMLPDMDGIEVCKKLRADKDSAHLGIIILTAKNSEVEKILGLELGADDYITKPFSPHELVARVKAVLRRKEKPVENDVISVTSNLQIDLNRHQTLLNGQAIKLTSTEFKILSLLASKIGWVYSREQILNHLWNNEKYVIDRTIDVHVKHLREKLGDQGSLIKNVRGVGYKLET